MSPNSWSPFSEVVLLRDVAEFVLAGVFPVRSRTTPFVRVVLVVVRHRAHDALDRPFVAFAARSMAPAFATVRGAAVVQRCSR